MTTPVLYDVQGPRARKRVLTASVVGAALLASLVFAQLERAVRPGSR